MMSRDSISKRAWFRWICPLCTILAYAILSLLPIGVAAQVVRNPPALVPGLHDLSCRVQANPRSATRCPFRVTIHPTRLSLSFLHCISGSEAEMPAGAGRRRGADPHRSGARGTRRHHRRAGFGARRLEQPRKREGSERIARHGPGPLLNRQEKGRGHRLQHGRCRLVAFCGEIPGTLQRGDSSRRQAAGIRFRVAASGSGDSFSRRPGRTFWPDRGANCANFRKPA